MSEIFSKLSSNPPERNTGSQFIGNTDRSQNRQHPENVEINESFAGIVTSFTVYKLLSELVKPISQLEAFRAGLIDINGNFIKADHALSRREHEILSPFNRLIIGIKRLILTTGSSKLKADYGTIPTAAKAMAMECQQMGGDPNLFLQELEKSLNVLCEDGESTSSSPGMSIGGGFDNPQVGEKTNIALAGFSPPMGLLRRKRRKPNGMVES